MTIIEGSRSSEEIPEQIKGWNWGAFLLNWIWGVGNNTYISLLTFVPFFGIIMLFVLGAKGNEWAWRNGRWDDVEHFKLVQKRWATWGFIILAAGVGLIGAMFGGLLYGLRNSDAYAMGVAQLRQSPAATDVLGTPIATGFPLGSISLSGQSGKAALNFSVTGSRTSGQVALQAIKTDGAWSLTQLEIFINGAKNSINVVR